MRPPGTAIFGRRLLHLLTSRLGLGTLNRSSLTTHIVIMPIVSSQVNRFGGEY